MAKKSKRRVAAPVSEPREAEVVKTEVRRVEAEQPQTTPVVRNIIIVILVLIGLYFIMNLISSDDTSDDGKAAEETSQTENADQTGKDGAKDEAAPSNLPADTVVEETDAAFSYTVGEGESYTTVARRAVSAIDSKLTTAERVAAETKLTTDAQAELLAIGQGVTLSKDTVRGAVDWAKSLSSEEKAVWQPYADLVAW